MGPVQPQRWARVAPSWLGHRVEPLIHERMWACPLELPDGVVGHDGRVHEAGFDAAGRPIVLRRSEHAPGPYAQAQAADEVETVEYRGREVVVNMAGHTVAATTVDQYDRPRRTVYSGTEEGEETYHYDRAGRLAAIDEAQCLWRTVSFYEMWELTGGRLNVEHDDRGPTPITDSAGGIRWERWDEPWPQLLDRGARAIRDGAVRVTEADCRAHALPPTTEVFALALTYVAQGSLYVSVSFGLEADRKRWLDDPINPEELATKLWYLSGNGEGPIYIEEDVIDSTLDTLLLREAALKQPSDPYRVVLNAAAARLARHDWASILTTTDDFVVYIAEHDEGYAPKHDSVRAVNPPERLALWDARWPDGVPRDEGELSH